MLTKKYLDNLTYEIIGCAIEVHKALGRGLLESAYHKCLIEELKIKKIDFQTEMKIPFEYKGKTLDIDFRCDLYIENAIVVELKAVNEINSFNEAQLLTYMSLLKCPKGILINFNCFNIYKEGQRTFVNNYYSSLPNI